MFNTRVQGMSKQSTMWGNNGLLSVDSINSTEPAVAGLVIIFAITLVYLSYCMRFTSGLTSKNNNDRKLPLPPYAPGGMIKHIQMISSSQYPWWILDVARQIQTRVFRISIPVRPLAHTVVVGEPNLFRQILTDPLTEKPLGKLSMRMFRKNGK